MSSITIKRYSTAFKKQVVREHESGETIYYRTVCFFRRLKPAISIQNTMNRVKKMPISAYLNRLWIL